MEKAQKAGKTGTHFYGMVPHNLPPLGIRADGGQTHDAFAKQAAHFRIACGLVPLPPTGRQASKFRRCKGSAYMAWVSAGKPVEAPV